jgi:hypothetical protein
VNKYGMHIILLKLNSHLFNRGINICNRDQLCRLTTCD